MPDRDVKALIYWIWHGRLTDYYNLQPVSFEETDFGVQVEGRKATFTFEKDLEAEEQATEAVTHHINRWEFSANLEHGPEAFRLHFERVVIVETDPPVVGGVQARGTLGPAMGSAAPTPKGLTAHPTPPSDIKVTPEANWALCRSMRYRQGAGSLPDTVLPVSP